MPEDVKITLNIDNNQKTKHVVLLTVFGPKNIDTNSKSYIYDTYKDL